MIEYADREVVVPRAKLRALLACLLVHCGQLVTVEGLIAELWADRPPDSAGNTLQTYVSQLRQLLDPDCNAAAGALVLRTVPGGYLLDIASDAVDSARFEAALSEGREAVASGDVDRAVDVLSQGLSLWRGPALANVEGAGARSEAARLDELRLVALELLIESELSRGRHREVVGALESLVREHPWRERFVSQLMIALYRCDRQADALARYRLTRNQLAQELGISPSEALRELEERILRQDPHLETTHPPSTLPARDPVTTPPINAPHVEARSTGKVRRGVALTGIVLLVAILPVEPTTHSEGRPPAKGTAEILNDFDLAVHPGIGYDLDIPPGARSDWHATNNPRSPDYDFLDFYMTSPAAPRHQISGVDIHGVNEFNAIHLVADDDTPGVCRGLPQRGGGFVAMSDLHVGAKVCLRTHDERWAAITVTRMPANRAALLFLHVTVLNS